ncbi:undecaprenyl-diphosphatase [Virgibacillus natechei]|uniref:Undecaprenyl-diphosphatase n=1 Tax=Virgibacillus natechei TaxID=1216297 RepID=A0ABS4IED9_9BACI|nr:phosphatase PAP2 family protein [Virgibacillus natechei]MBP1968990.1 undecaprenyl-diphosphatase [Virgibacillus natechei]UZD14266.1 phosphatase PAP2 family protein [Virgibacillus natechei]
MLNRRNYIILFLFTLVVIMIGIWVSQIVRGNVPLTDQWTRNLVERVDGTVLFSFFRAVTELGSENFLIVFTITMAIVMWLMLRDWLPALIFAGGTLVSHLFNMLIKRLVGRDRPSILEAANAEGYSFPSGHAMITMVCYGLLAYFIVKRLYSTRAIFLIQLFFSLLIFLVGISRYFINVHYLTDVVSGFIIGFFCLIGFIYLYEFIQSQRTSS